MSGEVRNSLRGGFPSTLALLFPLEGALGSEAGSAIYVGLPEGGRQPNDRRYPILVVGPGYEGLLTSESTRIPGSSRSSTCCPLRSGAKMRSAPSRRRTLPPRSSTSTSGSTRTTASGCRRRCSSARSSSSSRSGAGCGRARLRRRAPRQPRARDRRGLGLLGRPRRPRPVRCARRPAARGASPLAARPRRLSRRGRRRLPARPRDRRRDGLAVPVRPDPELPLLRALEPPGDDAARAWPRRRGPPLRACSGGRRSQGPRCSSSPRSPATDSARTAGGAIVLAAGFAVLAVLLAGGGRRALAFAVAASLAVALGLIGLDAATGGSSHVTSAIEDGPLGLGGDLVERVELSWERATSSWWVGLAVVALLVILAGLVVRTFRRPEPLAELAVPLAFAAAIAVSLVVNDSPDRRPARRYDGICRRSRRYASRAMARVVALVLALGALVVVAACGGSEDTTPTPETVIGTVSRPRRAAASGAARSRATRPPARRSSPPPAAAAATRSRTPARRATSARTWTSPASTSPAPSSRSRTAAAACRPTAAR